MRQVAISETVFDAEVIESNLIAHLTETAAGWPRAVNVALVFGVPPWLHLSSLASGPATVSC